MLKNRVNNLEEKLDKVIFYLNFIKDKNLREIKDNKKYNIERLK
jgi:hypothetical protein